jgi:ABC-type multidrug transport system fused ATPase/permease subunit
MAQVLLKDVKKIYDNDFVAVRDINLNVNDKEFMVIVGPSGCGKTTILRMIVRVILKDPTMVILDEATSSVDSVTEKLIQESIDNMLKNRTAFIIAHRLSTIQKCDRIIVLDNRKIAETGTHQELLNKKGIYFSMHSVYGA